MGSFFSKSSSWLLILFGVNFFLDLSMISLQISSAVKFAHCPCNLIVEFNLSLEEEYNMLGSPLFIIILNTNNLSIMFPFILSFTGIA